MKKTIGVGFLFLCFMVPQMSFAMTAECKANIKKAGYRPVCDEKKCEEFMTTESAKKLCKKDIPIQALNCWNHKTRETRHFPTDQVLGECTKLNAEDSHWQLSQCYCCCS
jgi:hypothetical protein